MSLTLASCGVQDLIHHHQQELREARNRDTPNLSNEGLLVLPNRAALTQMKHGRPMSQSMALTGLIATALNPTIQRIRRRQQFSSLGSLDTCLLTVFFRPALKFPFLRLHIPAARHDEEVSNASMSRRIFFQQVRECQHLAGPNSGLAHWEFANLRATLGDLFIMHRIIMSLMVVSLIVF